MPRTVGMVLSSGKATLREMEEYYSVEDLYDLIEVVLVDAHNRRAMMPRE